jgi:hypothetical protein
MTPHTVRQAVTPLRLVFWGGILCVFDVSFTQSTTVAGVTHGFRFDFLNDAVGAILIAAGVYRLGTFPVSGRYSAVMKFALVVSLLAIADAIRGHFIMPIPPAVQVADQVFGLVVLVTTIAFCIAMRWFCEAADLVEPARSWRVTTWLFVGIYLVPVGLLYLISIWSNLTGYPVNLNFGAAAVVLLPLFALPLVHLFISTSRMKRAAEAAEM